MSSAGKRKGAWENDSLENVRVSGGNYGSWGEGDYECKCVWGEVRNGECLQLLSLHRLQVQKF